MQQNQLTPSGCQQLPKPPESWYLINRHEPEDVLIGLLANFLASCNSLFFPSVELCPFTVALCSHKEAMKIINPLRHIDSKQAALAFNSTVVHFEHPTSVFFPQTSFPHTVYCYCALACWIIPTLFPFSSTASWWIMNNNWQQILTRWHTERWEEEALV